MIIIDILLNLYNPILFLPFLAYLIKKKRKFYMYFIYGIMIDLLFLNNLFLNTITLCLVYILYPKKKINKKVKYYFLLTYILIIISNILYYRDISYIFSPCMYLSIILNYLYFRYMNKNDFF